MATRIVQKSLFLFVLAFAVALALIGEVSRPSAALPNGARNTRLLAPVAVVGDSEAELQQNIVSAIVARKQPLYVTVRTISRRYLFSPYAQLVRTPNALVARAYGNVYVFALNDIRSVTYSGYTAALNLYAFPMVVDPKIEIAVARVRALRASGARRSQFLNGNIAEKERLCADCAMLLLDTRISQQLANAWNGKKDPWQIAPSYTFWRTAMRPIRPPHIKCAVCNPGDGSSGNDDPPGATQPPHDPDNDHTPNPPPPPYGTQGNCAIGFLSFSSGCEDDSVSFSANYANWFNPLSFFDANYVIRIDTTHYWNRHLACYLPNSTAVQWASAASQYFYLHVFSFNSDPAQGTQADYTFAYSGLNTTFRVYTVTAKKFYDVPTAFIVGKANCPGY